MPVSVRLASYHSDKEGIINTLQANLPYHSHKRFFPWLYLANPDGQALAWLAVDTDSGRIVGVAAAFPRRLYCSSVEARGYVLGDFCIAPEYRSLGLAVLLQRTCLEGLAAAGADFAFDLPSKAMLAVYKRLHIAANATMVRHAKPLRVDRKLLRRIPISPVARGLSAIANAGLKWWDASRVRNACNIGLQEEACGDEFTRAGENGAPAIRYALRVMRST